MRVHRQKIPQMPYVINIEEIADVAAPEEMGFESITEAFNNKIFDLIKPGDERICVLLRAEGLSYPEIAWITGKNKDWVESVLYRVRERIVKRKAKRFLIHPLSNGNLTRNS